MNFIQSVLKLYTIQLSIGYVESYLQFKNIKLTVYVETCI